MISLVFALADAGATPLEAFPLRADVVLPPTGPVRIHVPVGMRSPTDPVDGSDLLLVNGLGEEIPVVRIEGNEGRYATVLATMAPTDDPTRWDIAPEGPVDRLRVTLPDNIVSALVSVVRGDDLLAAPVRVWANGNGRQDLVELPRQTEPFSVLVVPRRPQRLETASPTFLLERAVGVAVPPEQVELTLDAPRMQENGWARWLVRVEPLLPVNALVLRTEDTNLDRRAGVVWRPLHEPAGYWTLEPEPLGNEQLRVRRLDGDIVEEQLRLTVTGPPTDGMLVLVKSLDQPPPVLTGVTAELMGVELFVAEPGPGPHTLFAGAPPGTAPVWNVALPPDGPDAGAPRVEVGVLAANPAFAPVEDRAELMAPGPPLDPEGWSWEREVDGEGLVRIPLPAEVVARARPDLGDLRLVDADRNQLPYLVRRIRAEQPVGVEVTHREELRGNSELRLHLEQENLPFVSLSFTTDATIFERRVTVFGTHPTRTLRTVAWRGDGSASTLIVELPGPVPQDLRVEIDNGDNGPLAVTKVAAASDGSELLARLPAGGARLWYGSPTTFAPQYDLAALDARWHHDLVARARSEGTLGEPRSTRAVAMRWFDRVLVGLGLAVLGFGVVFLLLDLLRKLPTPQAVEPAAPPAVG